MCLHCRGFEYIDLMPVGRSVSLISPVLLGCDFFLTVNNELLVDYICCDVLRSCACHVLSSAGHHITGGSNCTLLLT